MTAILNGNVRDQNGADVIGALVYVYDSTGGLADLQDSLAQALANPVTTGEDGYWEAYVADDGYYTLKFNYGGRLRHTEANVIAGASPLQQIIDASEEALADIEAAVTLATAEADRAEIAADAATALNVGSEFPSYAAGIAGTTAGEVFYVVSDGALLFYKNGTSADAADVYFQTGGQSARIPVFADIATTNVNSGVTVIETEGYAAAGDYGRARYVAVGTPDAAWDWPYVRSRWLTQTANGRWFMLDPSQPLNEHMFGAVGDAEHFPGILATGMYYSDDPAVWVSDYYAGPGLTGTPTDDYAALRALADYCTFIGGGITIDSKPGAKFWFANPRKVLGVTVAKDQVKRRDGLLVERIYWADDGGLFNPTFCGVDGLVWNANGSRWVQAPYHIPEGGHLADGTPRWHARGLTAYKCENWTVRGFYIDMNWRRHTSWSGRGFQRNDHGHWLNACKRMLFDRGGIHDSPHDCLYTTHRHITGIGGGAAPLDADLTYTETIDPTKTGEVYWPNGECYDIVYENYKFTNAARQAWSNIGARDLFFVNCWFNNTQQYLGTAPLNSVGAANHGLDDWQLPRLSPGCALDAEPNREHPRSCQIVTFVGCRFVNNFSIIGATGQGAFTRTAYSFTSAEVDAAANTITITGNLLPDALLEQRVRLYSEGTLPGGLLRYRDYYIHKSTGTDATFTLHRNRLDAINNVNPIDLTDGGTGTHRIAVYLAKSQVDSHRFIGCYADHPANGGDLFPGEITNFAWEGGEIINRSWTRALGDRGTYQGSYHFRNTTISGVAAIISSDDSKLPKTVSADAAADTINGTALGLDAYGFTRVRFSSTTTLPAPLQSNTDYWATYVTDNQCKLSVTEEAAFLGIYIDITDTGSGTHTLVQGSSTFDFTNVKMKRIPPPNNQFECPLDVNVADNTIHVPEGHGFGMRGEGRCQFRRLPGSTLPAPLVEGTTYYPRALDDYRYIVCATATNAEANPPVPIDLTDAGSGLCVAVPVGVAVQTINQRGTWDNVELHLDRRTYPPGASSVDAISLTRHGELRDFRIRTDLQPAEGFWNGVLTDCVLIDEISVPRNGTVRFGTNTGSSVGFHRLRQTPGTIIGDAAYTFDPRKDGEWVEAATTLTANRIVTLTTTGAFEGQIVSVNRTAGGAFNLTVNAPGTVLAAAGEWADFIFRNGAWALWRRK